jgi:hypothetical protein
MNENDAEMARIGRALADALRHYARDRDANSQKEISTLHAELCAARRAELEPPPPTKKVAE